MISDIFVIFLALGVFFVLSHPKPRPTFEVDPTRRCAMGMWMTWLGVALWGAVLLLKSARSVRAERDLPLVGPLRLARVLAKQHAPVREPVDPPPERLVFCAPRVSTAPESVRLLFAGDLGPTRSNMCWDEELRAYIRGHDLRVLNLEGAAGQERPHRGGLSFEIPGVQLDALLGSPRSPLFDAAVIANNHALDRGARGVDATLARLKERGVAPWGATPHVQEVGGLSIGVSARTFGCNTFWRGHPEVGVVPLRDWDNVSARSWLEELTGLRARTDFVIASYHWGFESEYWPSWTQAEVWSQLRAAGVDVLYGHHSHIVQPFTLEDGALCLYSCGNLSMDMGFARVYQQGALFSVEVARGESGWEVVGVETRWFESRSGVLRPIEARDAEAWERWSQAS